MEPTMQPTPPATAEPNKPIPRRTRAGTVAGTARPLSYTDSSTNKEINIVPLQEEEPEEPASLASANNPIWQVQQMGPSPDQTLYQLSIFAMKVTLYWWPRQRMSSKWTRDGNLNPGSISCTFAELLAGETKEKLVHIFGEEMYQKALQKVRELM
ncbi:hypothetical protein CXG81DRAFT_24474 [Caulochytrium protostelioides]|nr:hypothetical protein CXG81DRAFT_24474 [Caulochytrium protostelioides]|eukprot:RKP02874.1 hypothetical protein CXG81DRAFT_24474 [Caulochytrium protostelioides]